MSGLGFAKKKKSARDFDWEDASKRRKATREPEPQDYGYDGARKRVEDSRNKPKRNREDIRDYDHVPDWTDYRVAKDPYGYGPKGTYYEKRNYDYKRGPKSSQARAHDDMREWDENQKRKYPRDRYPEPRGTPDEYRRKYRTGGHF